MGKFAVLIGFLAVASACGSVRGFNPELFQEHMEKSIGILFSSSTQSFEEVRTALEIIRLLTAKFEESNYVDLERMEIAQFAADVVDSCSPGPFTIYYPDQIQYIASSRSHLPLQNLPNVKMILEECYKIMSAYSEGKRGEQFEKIATDIHQQAIAITEEIFKEDVKEEQEHKGELTAAAKQIAARAKLHWEANSFSRTRRAEQLRKMRQSLSRVRQSASSSRLPGDGRP